MTREEAIAVLEESKRQNEIMKDDPTTFWASYQIADGIKNTKRRIDALDAALSALRPVSREWVERIRGEWIEYEHPHIICCTRCDYGTGPKEKTRFCPYCGAPMTDEAVDMVMEKINNMEEMTNEH